MSVGPSDHEKKRKIYFQDGRHGGLFGFPTGTIFAFFYLQVTPMLRTKFRVNWPFGSGEEAKNRFSRLRSWRPSLISDEITVEEAQLPSFQVSKSFFELNSAELEVRPPNKSLKLLAIANAFLLNIAEHENFSAYKYENAKYYWHFHIH